MFRLVLSFEIRREKRKGKSTERHRMGNTKSASKLSCVQLFAALWTVAYQTPPSTDFCRQEY